MANVFLGKAPLSYSALGWMENLCYRAGGVTSKEAMNWMTYGKALLLFNIFGFVFKFLI